MEKKKKKLIVLFFVLIMALICAGIAGWLLFQKNNHSTGMQQPAIANMGEGVITASGLTSVGMTEETWGLDFLDTELYVEESYLSAGDEVETGTAVFKVSEATLEEARKELENAVTEAELLYRQGKLDYETEKLTALITYETASVNQKYARSDYNNDAAEAKKTVDDLETQVEEARKLVQEYEKSATEDYYRTYYKVDERYQTYYDHFNYLMEVYEKWEIEKLSDLCGKSVTSLTTSSQEQEGGSGGGPSTEGKSGAQSSSEQKLSVYNLFDELVQQEADDYTEAKKNYENAKVKAEAGLDQANSSLAELEAELSLAQTEYEKSLITCEADYQTTLAESENARTVYETTLQSLEEAYAELEDAKEEAQENLTLFEQTISDGYFYTQSSGTIVMNMMRPETYLSGENMVIAYSNPETVTIAASVDQGDIASIAVGDSAYVVVSEYGNFEGTVTAINPVTQAQSRSSVTYQVTVDLKGDISILESNLTACVYFGMTDEMLKLQEETKEPEAMEAPVGNEIRRERSGQ